MPHKFAHAHFENGGLMPAICCLFVPVKLLFALCYMPLLRVLLLLLILLLNVCVCVRVNWTSNAHTIVFTLCRFVCTKRYHFNCKIILVCRLHFLASATVDASFAISVVHFRALHALSVSFCMVCVFCLFLELASNPTMCNVAFNSNSVEND